MFAKIGPCTNRKARLPGRVVLLEHVGAGDVGGHQVGRELDAVEGEVEHLGERRDEQRLREPGHADEQAVAAREERDQQVVDDPCWPTMRFSISPRISRRASASSSTAARSASGEGGACGTGWVVKVGSIGLLFSVSDSSRANLLLALRQGASPVASYTAASPAWISGSNGSTLFASKRCSFAFAQSFDFTWRRARWRCSAA